MASFSLRSQRTGLYKDFSLLEILKLLGDHVNDEIWLEDGEDVFNLSSFHEIGSGTGSGSQIQSWNVEVPAQVAGPANLLPEVFAFYRFTARHPQRHRTVPLQRF